MRWRAGIWRRCGCAAAALVGGAPRPNAACQFRRCTPAPSLCARAPPPAVPRSDLSPRASAAGPSRPRAASGTPPWVGGRCRPGGRRVRTKQSRAAVPAARRARGEAGNGPHPEPSVRAAALPRASPPTGPVPLRVERSQLLQQLRQAGRPVGQHDGVILEDPRCRPPLRDDIAPYVDVGVDVADQAVRECAEALAVQPARAQR